MKKFLLYLFPLMMAFVIMILVNEYSRLTLDESIKNKEENMKINSASVMLNACTWNCHNDTNYCKQQHVKWLNSYLVFLDPLYFGIITLLGMMGSYVLANIFFLVILWPLLLSYLLIKSIRIQKKISLLKR